MDLIIVRYGRCNGCQEYQTIYEPVGDLLMEAHPTMRLGACLVCWAQMVAFVLALQEHGEDEPS